MLDVVALGELLIDFTCISADADGYPTMAAHPGGAPANYLANRVIALFHGRFPVLHYSFSETGMKIEDKKPETTYSAFIRLVEDGDYLYLFQSSQYGTMVKKSTVQGDGEADGLKRFLTEKTSLKWVAPTPPISQRSRLPAPAAPR